MFDILIKNGLIVDGSGEAAFYGDVAVKDGRIAAITPQITGDAVRTIDAAGLVVSPGFIDCHNHSDSDAFLGSSCYNSLEQGVTTQITGQCGYSPAPYYDGAMRAQQRYLPPEQFAEMAAAASTMETFMGAAETASIGANMAFFVGHNNLRGKTMGFSSAKPDGKQLQAMSDDLICAMEAGCLGFSTGLIYAPSAYGTTEELIALAKTMAPYGGIYASHIRNEADRVIESIKEAIRIGEEAGVQVHISHLKVMGLRNEGTSEKILQLIDDANARGVPVFADQYPYNASSAALNSRIPAKYHTGGTEALLERLKDQRIRREIDSQLTDYDCMQITSLPDTQRYVGRTVGQIACDEGKAPIDVLCDILIANHGEGQGIYFTQPEKDMMRILRHSRVFCGTDSSNFPDKRPEANAPGSRHPRGQAAFVRRLELQRDHNLCRLEESVRRITGGPAAAFHLEKQGLLRQGFDANITVFDYAGLKANAAYGHPYLPNKGIEYVLVNGAVAVENNLGTGIRAGRILKRSK